MTILPMFDRSREWRWRIQLQLTSNSFRVTNRCHDDKRMCSMNTEALERNGVPGLRPELCYHKKFQCTGQEAAEPAEHTPL